MDAYFCVAEFVEEIGLSRDEVEPMDVASDVLSSIEYSKSILSVLFKKQLMNGIRYPEINIRV